MPKLVVQSTTPTPEEKEAKRLALQLKKQESFQNHELPTTASRLYALAEMEGWHVKVVWATGPFTLATKEFQTSLSLRFHKKGRVPCAAVWLDAEYDAGYLKDFPGVLRTQKNLQLHLQGKLDLEAERLLVYPADPDIDKHPVHDGYVKVDKKKMLASEWLAFVKVANKNVRRRPEWLDK